MVFYGSTLRICCGTVTSSEDPGFCRIGDSALDGLTETTSGIKFPRSISDSETVFRCVCVCVCQEILETRVRGCLQSTDSECRLRQTRES